MKLRHNTVTASHRSSTVSGNTAEKAVCTYLAEHGYRIVEQNWRRTDCEIDIVAKKKRTLNFVEVKYRQGNLESAIAALTDTKLKQMAYSARRYCQEMNFDVAYQLMFVAVSGRDHKDWKIYNDLAK